MNLFTHKTGWLICAAGALVLSCLAATPARADGYGFEWAALQGQCETAASVGVLRFKDDLLNDAAAYRLRFLYRLTGRYAVEASGAVGSTEEAFVGGRRVRVSIYHSNIVYLFPMGGRTTTFTNMGIGGIARDVKGGEHRHDLVFTFGGGIRFRIWDRLGLRLDVGDFVSSVDIGGFLPSGGRVVVQPSGQKHMLEMDGGLSFAF